MGFFHFSLSPLEYKKCCLCRIIHFMARIFHVPVLTRVALRLFLEYQIENMGIFFVLGIVLVVDFSWRNLEIFEPF